MGEREVRPQGEQEDQLRERVRPLLLDPVVKFGETVTHKEPAGPTGRLVGGRRAYKADTQWHKGCWLGKATASDEHLIGAKSGVLTVRTIRRLPENQQAQREYLDDLVGEPWDTRTRAGRPRSRVGLVMPQAPPAGAPTTPAPVAPSTTSGQTAPDAAAGSAPDAGAGQSGERDIVVGGAPVEAPSTGGASGSGDACPTSPPPAAVTDTSMVAVPEQMSPRQARRAWEEREARAREQPDSKRARVDTVGALTHVDEQLDPWEDLEYPEELFGIDDYEMDELDWGTALKV